MRWQHTLQLSRRMNQSSSTHSNRLDLLDLYILVRSTLRRHHFASVFFFATTCISSSATESCLQLYSPRHRRKHLQGTDGRKNEHPFAHNTCRVIIIPKPAQTKIFALTWQKYSTSIFVTRLDHLLCSVKSYQPDCYSIYIDIKIFLSA